MTAGLGRNLSVADERDNNFLLPLRAVEAAPVTSRYWRSRGVLDQGNTSQCVAYSGVKYLTTSPIINDPVEIYPLYKECQRVDEWPGEDYEGTSIRALFKVLKTRGLVSEYRWARDVETVVNHVLTTGPVVMGTSWHMDMFMPDRWGYIWPIGESVGGHAWVIVGANRKRRNPDGSRGAVRMINSWGKGWAQKGRAWVSFGTLDTLMRDWAEACVATEVPLRD